MTARHDAVSVLTDAERWSSSPQAPFDPVLLGADPPIHSEMRSIVDDALGSAVRGLGSSGVSEIVREVLTTAFAHQTSEGSIDAVRDIASPISRQTLARVLGFPTSRLDELAQWSALHAGAPFDAEQARAGREQALKRLNAAIQGDVRDSTFIGHLGHSAFSGTITKAEAFRMCDTVVVGGLETTTVLLTTILELQAEHEDADPGDVLSTALVRRPPLRWQERADVTTGEVMTIDLETAVRCTRTPSLAFGRGPHRCAGETLARMEALALARSLRRWSIHPLSEPCVDLSNRMTRAISFPVILAQRA